MANKKNKSDPLLNVTDNELYKLATHVNCPTLEMQSAHRDLLESLEMPICCRFMDRWLQKPYTDVAKVLNQAGIGCVLWGHSLHGVYSLNGASPWTPEFVVADELIDKAVEVLCQNLPAAYGSVTGCPDEGQCVYAVWDYAHWNIKHILPHRGPILHIHTQLQRTEFENMLIIRLHKQSMTLWALPPLTEMPIPDIGSQANVGKLALSLAPNYTLASHPRFKQCRSYREALNSEGPARYPADLHPVVVPTPERALEALMRLYARYSYSSEVGRLHQWMVHLERPIIDFFEEIKMYNSSLIDVRRMTPMLGFIVQTVLQGNITQHKLRVILREALGEPAYDDKSYRETFFLLDDTLFSELGGWRLRHDDPRYLEKIGDCPRIGRKPDSVVKEPRKYWLKVKKEK